MRLHTEGFSARKEEQGERISDAKASRAGTNGGGIHSHEGVEAHRLLGGHQGHADPLSRRPASSPAPVHVHVRRGGDLVVHHAGHLLQSSSLCSDLGVIQSPHKGAL